jgi:hypothetical protein
MFVENPTRAGPKGIEHDLTPRAVEQYHGRNRRMVFVKFAQRDHAPQRIIVKVRTDDDNIGRLTLGTIQELA